MKVQKQRPVKISEEPVQPYGLMTDLQVHAVGYVYSYETKSLVGRKVEYRRGKGKETFFINVGNVRDEKAVKDACDRTYTNYILTPKFNTDGTPYEEPRAVVFVDNRLKGKRPPASKQEATAAVAGASSSNEVTDVAK